MTPKQTLLVELNVKDIRYSDSNPVIELTNGETSVDELSDLLAESKISQNIKNLINVDDSDFYLVNVMTDYLGNVFLYIKNSYDSLALCKLLKGNLATCSNNNFPIRITLINYYKINKNVVQCEIEI
jgi:hypothetical protein